MKGRFESVHQHGPLDAIQPLHDHHQQWDHCATVGHVAATSSASYLKPPLMAENRSMNMERNELSQWVEHVTKQLLEDLPENETEISLQDTTVMHENDNTDSRPRKIAKYCNELAEEDHDQTNSLVNVETTTKEMMSSSIDEHGLSLITNLFECAVAISVDNLGEAHRMLLELTQSASPYAASCAERVVAYFSKAMASRVINSWLGISSPLINHKSVHGAFQIFNNISPFIKFAHFTSNQEILEAFHRRQRVHIIDLDIMQGLQWPALFHILATRVEGPPHVRMTGMGASMELLTETGKQLSNFAKRLGMPFEFHPIAKKFGDIGHTSLLQIRRGEALGVHWLQHSSYDAVGPDRKTMRLLQELSPRVITLVEQEIAHRGSFLDRFVSSLHYYSAMFDSLGAFLQTDDSNRHRVEHGLFHREINNILAIGGPARSGEDKFRHWRSELARNGFMQIPMSTSSMAQAQLILNMCAPGHGYSLVQGDGTLMLGWKDTSLYTASAWTSPASTSVYACK